MIDKDEEAQKKRDAEVAQLISEVKAGETSEEFSFTDEISSALVKCDTKVHEHKKALEVAHREFYNTLARYRGYKDIDDAHNNNVQFIINRIKQTVVVCPLKEGV